MADGVWGTPERVSSERLSLAEIAAASAMARNMTSFGGATRGDGKDVAGFHSDISADFSGLQADSGYAVNCGFTVCFQ